MNEKEIREKFVELAPKEWRAHLFPPSTEQNLSFYLGDPSKTWCRFDVIKQEARSTASVNDRTALALLKWLGATYDLWAGSDGSWVVTVRNCVSDKIEANHQHPEPVYAVLLAVIARLSTSQNEGAASEKGGVDV